MTAKLEPSKTGRTPTDHGLPRSKRGGPRRGRRVILAPDRVQGAVARVPQGEPQGETAEDFIHGHGRVEYAFAGITGGNLRELSGVDLRVERDCDRSSAHDRLGSAEAA